MKTIDEKQANANDLLKALEEVTKELHDLCGYREGWDDINGRIIPNALAVIKRAKGE